MEYIYGKNTIESFCNSNQLLEVFVLPSFSDRKILELLSKKKVKVSVKNKDFFDKNATNGNHQGIIGIIKSFNYSTLEKIIENGKRRKYPFILVLDGIEDPHNFGAIIRSVEAFSLDGIIIAKNNSCPITSTVAKVSTGAIANVDIAQVSNITQTLKKLKELGYWVCAAEANNGIDYNLQDYKMKTVLVMGSEGYGISHLVKKQADFNIYIPMTGHVNSLNVSVATAILVSTINFNQCK